MMTKTIIFDYDGTIHHTLGIYEPAFRETYQWLTEQKVTEEREIGSVEIAGWLGLNSKEMWNTFLPELDQSYKEQASRMVGDLMVRQIRKHKAVWYPGAEEMLTALKNRGYHLVILSNCKASYREAHWKEFGMERWFDRFYDCESYRFRPKTEIVQEIIREYSGVHGKGTGAKPTDVPKTGDDTNLWLPLLLMVLSAAGLTGLAVSRRRKKRKNG